MLKHMLLTRMLCAKNDKSATFVAYARVRSFIQKMLEHMLPALTLFLRSKRLTMVKTMRVLWA